MTDFSGSFALSLTTSDSDNSNSLFIANNRTEGIDLLTVIKRELSSCTSFDFCVAFISDGGLQPLVEILSELRRSGVSGRLLTSTYLNFNSPDTYRKLLEYDNIQSRVYQGHLHAKGYVFDRSDTSTLIVGSSNLTQQALTCNKEWNVLFRTQGSDALLTSIKDEFSSLWESTETTRLTPEWISSYERYRHQAPSRRMSLPSFRVGEKLGDESPQKNIEPNDMQRHALQALAVLHQKEQPRALLVSATGTGKTYLSAFDIQATKPERVLFLAHRQRILDASMRSYRSLLGGSYTYGYYSPAADEARPTCLFAMSSTIVRHLDEFDPRSFDYIVIDEAHRTGSQGYQSIMSHFEPKFYLGMTATPSRTDGYDVFALFNHVIAYQITLQDALENDMLAPFHYFGIADLEIDDQTVDDPTLFSKLTSQERVRHIIQKIEEYTVVKSQRRGLIFCNRNDEAAELSRLFNEAGYRTRALSGADSDETRTQVIKQLEAGEIEYIFSVDILNEGIDIPPLNQIIMLRRTDSAIVFVQQLGRGLRKADDKDYALVLDFIGNYQQNFFVPIALSGDRTYNKDSLRAIVNKGSLVVPGCSTVDFDEISRARIYHAIDMGNFSSAKLLKDEYLRLKNMLGRIPKLEDFDSNDAIDPLRIFKKYGSYHAFLSKCDPYYKQVFSSYKQTVLEFISRKLASGKRFEDLALLRNLMDTQACTFGSLRVSVERAYGRSCWEAATRSAANLLSGAFGSSGKVVRLVYETTDGYELDPRLEREWSDDFLREQVPKALSFGLQRNKELYANPYRGTSFVLNARYTYEEICCYLGWDKNVNGQNIGGYKYDSKTNTFPVFINYEKAPDISASTRYEDRFVSNTCLIALSKSGRKLESPDIQRLKAAQSNGMKAYLFVRKNKDDKDGGKEFYFLGEIHPTGEFQPIIMPSTNKSAVEITYRLDTPVKRSLFAYLTSNLDDEAA